MEIITSLIAAILVVLILTGIIVGLIILLDRSFLAGIIGLMTLLTVAIWISMHSEMFLQ